MTISDKIKNDSQKLVVGSEMVELYSLDATAIGGSTYYFTPGTIDNANILFNGIEYVNLPVEITGMETPGDGTLPRPRLKISNVNLTFIAFVNEFNDGIGAKITRIRTFKKYLDGQTEADSSAVFPHDVFFIEQKVVQNKYFIEWEILSPIDIGFKYLPRNQVLPYCQHRYRVYIDGSFDYTNATCPYTSHQYFDDNGISTTIDGDMCGKKLSDCTLRYPNANSQLPFKGFPVVGQVGQAYK